MDKPDQQPLENQKLIGRITRIAGAMFLVVGILVMVMGGDMILGSVLALVGLTDLVLMPRIIETIITEKLKQRQNNQE